ncbi:hypothetical protein METBIDRAFT_11228 [Metschnikowia bicuspidata var. bicuspidata NRRL YB-4993]|uniref:Uncharacterized protein n=1 Tax=Metschnikowia bicuspidata var. bicuspidata NRRL YB-4993 TaxID=869754 RepID=A0A1A0HES1_9ASCO|nr:hypothetical protein METBIDRAFT_11228 [Metschnikowia bicuspidata var. bicuspidata NRRL YB-4993]OBA22387.1 hypothetical protein METBIDRAFT_11228 [Metschnikowia bicuspidata var. bicuspidata NRRL YB-4993]
MGLRKISICAKKNSFLRNNKQISHSKGGTCVEWKEEQKRNTNTTTASDRRISEGLKNKIREETLLSNKIGIQGQCEESPKAALKYPGKHGSRKRLSGMLKHGVLGFISGLSRLEHRRQIVFDEKYDLNWQLGYIPEIDLNCLSAPHLGADDTGASKALRSKHITYSKRMPYPSSKMCSSGDSVESDFELRYPGYSASTAEDESIMEKFKGIRVVYLGDEAHLAILNTGPDSSSEEQKKGAYLKKTEKEVPSKVAAAIRPTISEVGKEHEKYLARVQELKTLGMLSSCSQEPSAPPKLDQSEPILRPFRLLKGISSPKTSQNTNAQGQAQILPEALEATASHSPLIQAGLRELKLVRRRGNHVSIPVWLNLMRNRQIYPETCRPKSSGQGRCVSVQAR